MILTRGLGRGGPLVTAGIGVGTVVAAAIPVQELPAGKPSRPSYWTPPQPATIVLTGRHTLRLQIRVGQGGHIERGAAPVHSPPPPAETRIDIRVPRPLLDEPAPSIHAPEPRPHILTGRHTLRLRICAGQGGSLHRRPPPWLLD